MDRAFQNANLCTITYEQVIDAMDAPYTMELNLTDAQVVQEVVNLGIDSHLEACFVPSRGDAYQWDGRRLNCVVSKESLPVLLRRLFEYDFGGDTEKIDLATCLGEDILQTLGTFAD